MADPSRDKPRILVIEDNPGDVALLRLALESAGLDCELTVIEDGGEALALIRGAGGGAAETPLDLVIVDLNLPKNDGLEVVQAMRANVGFDAVPITVFSSSSLPRERAQLEELGVRKYFVKPADLDEVTRIGVLLKDLIADPGGAAVEKEPEGRIPPAY